MAITIAEVNTKLEAHIAKSGPCHDTCMSLNETVHGTDGVSSRVSVMEASHKRIEKILVILLGGVLTSASAAIVGAVLVIFEVFIKG